MHRLASLLVISLIVVGCASRAGTPPGESVPATEPSAATEPSPSPVGPPSPAASETSGTCPTARPLSVTAYLAADPACFGSRDVQIEGWEDIPDGIGDNGPSFDPTWIGQALSPYSVISSGLFVLPCNDPCRLDFMFVYISPTADLRFEADGLWVIITGHRNDLAAESCTYTGAETIDLTAEQIRQKCRDHFVLTSVTAATPPASARPSCPTASPMRVTEYMNADPVCFGARDVSVIGWQDQPPIVGQEPPSIVPDWLWSFSASMIWQKPPGFGQSANGQTCTVDDCHSFFVQIKPDSGLRFDARGRWVKMIGHRQDPAAESCHFVYPPDFGAGERPPDLFARQQCRAAFVLTSVSVAAAPAHP